MTPTPSLHALLLLSDSALPLGSFAFSSGLESFLAHTKPQHPTSHARQHAFDAFLAHSLANVASTALPYVLAAFHDPCLLVELDNDFDASTPCTVARRASIAQGRALLALWERALCPPSPAAASQPAAAARELTRFAQSAKSAAAVGISGLQQPNTHFPPLFGAVCRALALTADDTAYIFLLNHAKALLSAAVRASVMGPYQAQALLASDTLQRRVNACAERERGRGVADAAVTAPVIDLWMGRHELLYSRIFNS
ncbi:hypothetical protein LTR08_002820 [Meristemomyces frigidus]|nr:hypothetical protein LTR08_002820 [Meristemomyces frigidus]